MSGWAVLLLLAAASGDPADYSGRQRCLPCHQRETPGLVKPWASSAHARAKVSCADCHGEDGASNHPGDGSRSVVDAEICGRCHKKALQQHRASKHGIGFRAGRACTRNRPASPGRNAGCRSCHEKGSELPIEQVECARFLAQTPEMQRQGCMACHQVETRCDSCHSAHGTDLALVRDPGSCATCHMGPDHAQYEMWKTSRHGVAWALQGEASSPSCVGCHMPGGSHDVSQGISMGLGGQPYPPEKRRRERTRMVAICARCHTPAFATRQLDDGDAIQRQSKALLNQAAALVKALDAEGLLEPAPEQRPRHPLAGARLEIGAQMLYQDLSRAEAIFFRMQKFHYVTAYKGVFHQNPDYAHWYGHAPLQLALSALQSEAALLRRLHRLEQRLDLANGPGAAPATEAAGVKVELRALRERLLRGELDDQDFERQQRELLDRHGL